MTVINCTAPFLVFSAVKARLDPFYYIFVMILPNHPQLNVLIVSLRGFLCLCCLILGYRHFNMVCIIGFVLLRNVRDCLECLVLKTPELYLSQKMPAWHWIKCRKCVSEYRVFFTFFVFYAQEMLSNIVFASMTVALVAGIILNFSILRFYNLFPLPLLIIISFRGVVFFVLAAKCFPVVTGILESSSRIQRQWIQQARAFPPMRRRLFLREIRCLMPCGVKMSVGKCNFMLVDNAVKMTYFRRYVEYTINACLSVPNF
jgi:hypothetical protein